MKRGSLLWSRISPTLLQNPLVRAPNRYGPQTTYARYLVTRTPTPSSSFPSLALTPLRRTAIGSLSCVEPRTLGAPSRSSPLTHASVWNDPYSFSGMSPFHPLKRGLARDGRSYRRGPNDDDEYRPTLIQRAARPLVMGGSLLFLMAGKLKFVFAGLKIFKLASLGSILLNFGLYGMLFGWPYAAGVVSNLVVHESGHALAMQAKGIPFHPMVLIPFFGAGVVMKEMPKNVYDDAMIALAGPALGGAFATAVGLYGVSTNNQLMIAIGDFGIFLNLFNLLPIGMLDGGTVAGALSKWILLPGLGLGGYACLTGITTHPMSYILMLAATYTTYLRFTDPPHQSYYKMGGGSKAFIAASYGGLILALLAAAAELQKRKKDPRQLRDRSQPMTSLERTLEGYKEDLTDDPYFTNNPYQGGDSSSVGKWY